MTPDFWIGLWAMVAIFSAMRGAIFWFIIALMFIGLNMTGG